MTHLYVTNVALCRAARKAVVTAPGGYDGAAAAAHEIRTLVLLKSIRRIPWQISCKRWQRREVADH